jgi:hypothetical protein
MASTIVVADLDVIKSHMEEVKPIVQIPSANLFYKGNHNQTLVPETDKKPPIRIKSN